MTELRDAFADGLDRTGPRVVPLSEVAPERVEWLWPGYLPAGKLVVLDGDPGVGKSTVVVDLAARISSGAAMPDGAAGKPGDVLLLSAEDGLADTIRPRLDAAWADPARVHALTEITEVDDTGAARSRPPTLPGDLQAVEKIVADRAVRLVVVDVLMAYLGGEVNSHRDQDVRRALHQLAALAERHGCCVLVLRHLNKAGGSNALYRGGGSIGIVGAARAAFIVATDPDDDNRRVLAPTKMNIAAMPASLAYRLVSDELRGCARVAWDGTVERSAGQLLQPAEDEEEKSDRDEAAEWLRDFIADQGGEARAADVFKVGKKEGLGDRQLKRARSRAGIGWRRSGFGQGSVWFIRDSDPNHSGHRSGRSGQASEGVPDGPNGVPNEVPRERSSEQGSGGTDPCSLAPLGAPLDDGAWPEGSPSESPSDVANIPSGTTGPQRWRIRSAPADAVHVDRRTKWGNPYTVEKYGREEAVRAHRENLAADTLPPVVDKNGNPKFDPITVADVRRELPGYDLACWCQPGEQCHADTLIAIANAQETQNGDALPRDCVYCGMPSLLIDDDGDPAHPRCENDELYGMGNGYELRPCRHCERSTYHSSPDVSGPWHTACSVVDRFGGIPDETRDTAGNRVVGMGMSECRQCRAPMPGKSADCGKHGKHDSRQLHLAMLDEEQRSGALRALHDLKRQLKNGDPS